MRFLRDAVLVGAFASLLAAPAVAQTLDEREVEIAAGRASDTLREFFRQTGIQYSADSRLTKRVTTQAVSGRLTPAAALARMLEGTELTFELVDERTVSIVPRAAVDHDSRQGTAASEEGRSTRRGPRTGRDIERIPRRARLLQPLDEVLVVGPFIRGIEPVGSQKITLGQRQLARSVYGSVRDVIRALPAVFGGGPSEDTSLGDEASSNIGRGTGINLRGLNAGST
ncbi:MAG TPA: STN domain-containing protein, partial [Steroidobacteraceae bacterium]|nr:STN domain-containing protein [Steroidobacteraceae bacterium]